MSGTPQKESVSAIQKFNSFLKKESEAFLDGHPPLIEASSSLECTQLVPNTIDDGKATGTKAPWSSTPVSPEDPESSTSTKAIPSPSSPSHLLPLRLIFKNDLSTTSGSPPSAEMPNSQPVKTGAQLTSKEALSAVTRTLFSSMQEGRKGETEGIHLNLSLHPCRRTSTWKKWWDLLNELDKSKVFLSSSTWQTELAPLGDKPIKTEDEKSNPVEALASASFFARMNRLFSEWRSEQCQHYFRGEKVSGNEASSRKSVSRRSVAPLPAEHVEERYVESVRLQRLVSQQILLNTVEAWASIPDAQEAPNTGSSVFTSACKEENANHLSGDSKPNKRLIAQWVSTAFPLCFPGNLDTLVQSTSSAVFLRHLVRTLCLLYLVDRMWDQAAANAARQGGESSSATARNSPFWIPVAEQYAPNYYRIIAKPVCLADFFEPIYTGINSGSQREAEHSSSTETRDGSPGVTFLALRELFVLVASNAERYNGLTSEIAHAAQQLKQDCSKEFRNASSLYDFCDLAIESRRKKLLLQPHTSLSSPNEDEVSCIPVVLGSLWDSTKALSSAGFSGTLFSSVKELSIPPISLEEVYPPRTELGEAPTGKNISLVTRNGRRLLSLELSKSHGADEPSQNEDEINPDTDDDDEETFLASCPSTKYPTHLFWMRCDECSSWRILPKVLKPPPQSWCCKNGGRRCSRHKRDKILKKMRKRASPSVAKHAHHDTQKSAAESARGSKSLADLYMEDGVPPKRRRGRPPLNASTVAGKPTGTASRPSTDSVSNGSVVGVPPNRVNDFLDNEEMGGLDNLEAPIRRRKRTRVSTVRAANEKKEKRSSKSKYREQKISRDTYSSSSSSFSSSDSSSSRESALRRDKKVDGRKKANQKRRGKPPKQKSTKQSSSDSDSDSVTSSSDYDDFPEEQLDDWEQQVIDIEAEVPPDSGDATFSSPETTERFFRLLKRIDKLDAEMGKASRR